MATYVELKEKAEDLLRQAEAARKEEIGAAIAEIKSKMMAYGITLDDLGGKAGARRGRKLKGVKAGRPTKGGKLGKTSKAKIKMVATRKPVAAKYRNTATGESWSGRGKAPRWLMAMEAAGRSRSEFAV